MWFMNWIIDRLNYISGWFYELYYDCYYVGWPLDVLADWFYYLADAFASLAWDFYDFSQWLTDLSNSIAGFLNWTNIWLNILSYVPNLEDIRDWFYNWWLNVYGVVTDWWSSTSTTVLSWIDEAKAWTQIWIDYLQDQVTALGVRIDDVLALIPDVSDIQLWFTNWTGNVISVIGTWWTGALIEVQSLIDSAFTEREPFWAGWQEWRAKVTEFFTDPEDWLYKSLDRIVERFW